MEGIHTQWKTAHFNRLILVALGAQTTLKCSFLITVLTPSLAIIISTIIFLRTNFQK